MDIEFIRRGLAEVANGTTPDRFWVQEVESLLDHCEEGVEVEQGCSGGCCNDC